MSCVNLITNEVRDRYSVDGVVCLRNAITEEWINCTRDGIARNLEQPGRFFRDQTPADSPARYVFDFWVWQQIPEFTELIKRSPIAEMVGELLGASHLNLLMDNWFMRESGATSGAPWHHDEPYFDFSGGKKCVFWYPLEPVSVSEGLTFLAGSHQWGQLFMPSHFREKTPFEGDMTGYRSIDSVEFDAPNHRFLNWEMEVGDCLIFDFRTLHAATTDTAAPATIQRMSLRYGDQNVRFKPRGEWTIETSEYLKSLGCKSEGRVDCDLLPRVWEAS